MAKDLQKEPDFYPFRVQDHGWVLKKNASIEFIGEAFRDIVYQLVSKDFTPGSVAEAMYNDAVSMMNANTEKARKAANARWNNGVNGGRPKKNIGDAPTREDGEDTTNGGITTASAVLESGTSPTNMPRVGQNEARPRIQGGERPAQGPMSLSPEEAAQSGNLYNGSAKSQGSANPCGRGGRATTQAPTTSPSAQTSGKPILIRGNDQVPAHPRGYTGASRGASTARNSTKSTQKSKIPGNFDTVIDWCVEHGQDIDDARQIWDMTRERNGHDADGNKIENWWGFLVQCLKTKKENRK